MSLGLHIRWAQFSLEGFCWLLSVSSFDFFFHFYSSLAQILFFSIFLYFSIVLQFLLGNLAWFYSQAHFLTPISFLKARSSFSVMGSMMVPFFVVTAGAVSFLCTASGTNVLPTGALTDASKSFTDVNWYGSCDTCRENSKNKYVKEKYFKHGWCKS